MSWRETGLVARLLDLQETAFINNNTKKHNIQICTLMAEKYTAYKNTIGLEWMDSPWIQKYTNTIGLMNGFHHQEDFLHRTLPPSLGGWAWRPLKGAFVKMTITWDGNEDFWWLWLSLNVKEMVKAVNVGMSAYSCDGDWISNFTCQMFTLERGKRRKIITAWKRCHTCNIICCQTKTKTAIPIILINCCHNNTKMVIVTTLI